jgi:hypothetical protein
MIMISFIFNISHIMLIQSLEYVCLFKHVESGTKGQKASRRMLVSHIDELANIREALTEFETELLAKKATKIVKVASFSFFNL